MSVITNGMGRGILPAGHPLLVTRARSVAFGQADLVVVAGAPLDFRLGYGVFGGKDDRAAAPVVHIADSPGQLARHVDLAGSASGDLGLVLGPVVTGLVADAAGYSPAFVLCAAVCALPVFVVLAAPETLERASAPADTEIRDPLP